MKSKSLCFIVNMSFFMSPCYADAGNEVKRDSFAHYTLAQNVLGVDGLQRQQKDVVKPSVDSLSVKVKSDEKTINSYHNIELSLMYHYFDYKEYLPVQLKSTETGWLPGIYLGWSYSKKNSIYMKLFFEYSFGDLTYDGTTQYGDPVKYSENNQQKLFRGEFNIGYDYAATRHISLKPYIGFGFRWWSRGERNLTAEYSTFNGRYYWQYFSVGIATDIQFNDKISIQPNAGLRFMFNGKVTAYLSQVSDGFSDLTFDLVSKTGWYAEVPVVYKVSKNWAVILKPWYEYSEIGKSNTLPLSNYVIANEPSSQSKQYGVNLGVVLLF